MTVDNTKHTFLLKPIVKMLQRNDVYIMSMWLDVSYRITRHLQQRFGEHIGNKGPVKSHFQLCSIKPNDVISMLGRKHQTLKPVNTFIKEITIVLNTKD